MAIEIVDFPIKNGDFPLRTVSSPEGIYNHSELIQYFLGFCSKTKKYPEFCELEAHCPD